MSSPRFYLDGDLNQLSKQRRFLLNRGIEVVNSNVYPTVAQEDVYIALKLIWDNNVEGWWHYKEEYLKHLICTKKEFNIKLGEM